jgi:hypothetical protein
MKTHTTSRYYVASWSGLIFAGIAGIAATSLIIQDAFPNGWADWSHVKLEHALAPAIVAITAFLWLHAAREAREGRMAALALAAVAAFCSCLIVFESMGRGAEALDTKIKVAEVSEEQRVQAALSLQHARDRLAEVLPIKLSECRGAPVPLPVNGWPKCRTYTGSVEAYEASIASLEKKLETAKPVPVDARGERVAFIAGLFGYDGEVAKKAAQSLYPLARPLAFEFVMILLLHASVRTRSVESVPSVRTVSEPRGLSFENENGDRTDAEIEQIKKALEGLGHAVTNDQLAALLKCSKSEASKRWRSAAQAGVVEAQRAGRYVHLRLVKAA